MKSVRRGGGDGPGPDSPGREDLLACLLIAVVGVLFLHELSLVRGVPVARDVQLFFLPQRRIFAEAISQGRLAFWTPLISNGFPYFANFQSGFFYPPNWLFALLPFYTAFDWLIVLHLVMAGLGMYWLSRELGFRPAAALAAALAFMLGGYLASLTNLINVLKAAAWTPVLAVTLLRQVRQPGVGRFAGVVAAHLMGILAGEPQTFLLGAAVAVLLVLVSRAEGVSLPWRVRARRLAATLAGGGAAVAGLAMVQILPTARLVGQSVRSTGVGFDLASMFSLHPARLLHLVLPNDFSDPVYAWGSKLQIAPVDPWLFSVYFGVVALVLVYYALRHGERRTEVVTWSVLAVVGVLLTLGAYVPVFGWLFRHVPGFSVFRYPEKFFLLSGLAVPLLTAHGVSALRRRGTGRCRGDALTALGVLAAALGLVVFWSVGVEPVFRFARRHLAGAPFLDHPGWFHLQWGENLERLCLLLAVTVTTIGLYRRGRLRWRLASGILLLLLMADFWVAHRNLTPVVDTSFYEERPAVASVFPFRELRTRYRYRGTSFAEGAGEYITGEDVPTQAAKWLIQKTMQPSTGPLWAVMTQDSRDALPLRRQKVQHDLFQILPREEDRWRLLRLFSVRYLYSQRRFEDRLHGGRTALDSLPGYVYRVDRALPRAYLADGRTYGSQGKAVEALFSETFDPQTTVALTPPGAEGGGEAPVPGTPGGPAVDPAPAGTEPSDVPDSAGGRATVGSGGAGRPPPVEGRADGGGSPEKGRPGAARIVSDEGRTVRIRVEPRRPCYLVLTDYHYPGWQARVDGKERSVRMANYFFRAVRVEPGDREVVFRYGSGPFRRGAWISSVTLLLLLAGLGIFGRGTAGEGRRAVRTGWRRVLPWTDAGGARDASEGAGAGAAPGTSEDAGSGVARDRAPGEE